MSSGIFIDDASHRYDDVIRKRLRRASNAIGETPLGDYRTIGGGCHFNYPPKSFEGKMSFSLCFSNQKGTKTMIRRMMVRSFEIFSSW
jgi:hypothetical protein